jgi:hypothetical protein
MSMHLQSQSFTTRFFRYRADQCLIERTNLVKLPPTPVNSLVPPPLCVQHHGEAISDRSLGIKLLIRTVATLFGAVASDTKPCPRPSMDYCIVNVTG